MFSIVYHVQKVLWKDETILVWRRRSVLDFHQIATQWPQVPVVPVYSIQKPNDNANIPHSTYLEPRRLAAVPVEEEPSLPPPLPEPDPESPEPEPQLDPDPESESEPEPEDPDEELDDAFSVAIPIVLSLWALTVAMSTLTPASGNVYPSCRLRFSSSSPRSGVASNVNERMRLLKEWQERVTRNECFHGNNRIVRTTLVCWAIKYLENGRFWRKEWYLEIKRYHAAAGRLPAVSWTQGLDVWSRMSFPSAQPSIYHSQTLKHNGDNDGAPVAVLTR